MKIEQMLQEARTEQNAHYIDKALRWLAKGLTPEELDGKLEQWQGMYHPDSRQYQMYQQVADVVIAHIAETDLSASM